jgi:hypothetical protein
MELHTGLALLLPIDRLRENLEKNELCWARVATQSVAIKAAMTNSALRGLLRTMSSPAHPPEITESGKICALPVEKSIK